MFKQDSILNEILLLLIAQDGKRLIMTDETPCLESYYMNEYLQEPSDSWQIEFRTSTALKQGKATSTTPYSYVVKEKDYTDSAFTRYVLSLVNKYLYDKFKIQEDNPYKNTSRSLYLTADDREPYGAEAMKKKVHADNKISINDYFKEIPYSSEFVTKNLEPIFGDNINSYSDTISDLKELIEDLTTFINDQMYVSKKIKIGMSGRAYFTSYTSDDLKDQLQEIKTSDGRTWVRACVNEIWSSWKKTSIDQVGSKSEELTSGDVGAYPLGNQGDLYKFNFDIEQPMRAGETWIALTRDITLSGLPESLRYGSKGYRATPQDLLNHPVKGVHPNSMGCYGLFDPQNDPLEPDSNGMMEIMPSTELFSDEVPRPTMEQQKGKLTTSYDGTIYWQDWVPMSPTNSNWCDEKDTPRYTYYRRGTNQIADSVSGKKPYIKWTKWRAKENVQSFVDWGVVDGKKLSEMFGRKGLQDSMSLLSLPEIYEQPENTTYSWTIYEPRFELRMSGIPDIRNEGGPPMKLVDNDTGDVLIGGTWNGGVFDKMKEANWRRRSIFSVLTSRKTDKIIYFEWRDLGQLFQVGDNNGKIEDVFRLKPEEIKPRMLEMWMKQQVMFCGLKPGLLQFGDYDNPLWSMKMYSSDFCYYREGRVLSDMDISKLPQKKFIKTTKWNSWHSIDERILSIESRVRFIEALLGTPPGAGFTNLPQLSSKILTPNTITTSPATIYNLVSVPWEKLGGSRLIGGLDITMASGTVSPAFLLRGGYNVYNPDDYSFDTDKSFWGDHFIGSWNGDKEKVSTKFGEGIKFNGLASSAGFAPFNILDQINAPDPGVVCSALALAAYIVWGVFYGLGVALSYTGPGAIANAVAIMIVHIVTNVLIEKFFNQYFRKPVQFLHDFRELQIWSSPGNIGPNNKVRQVLGQSTRDMIDTSLFGWVHEIKRRTDLIKFLESFLHVLSAIVANACLSTSINACAVAAMVLPVGSTFGVLPIPFSAIPGNGGQVVCPGMYAWAFLGAPQSKAGDFPLARSMWGDIMLKYYDEQMKPLFEESTLVAVDGKLTQFSSRPTGSV